MDKVQEYINVKAFHKNLHKVLEENEKKFDTHKELLEYGLAQFTEEQINETLLDQPYMDDKQQFWYAARVSFIDKMKNVYLIAQRDISGPFFNEDIKTIDYLFNESIGIYTYFLQSVVEYSMLLEKVEACGIGEMLREM